MKNHKWQLVEDSRSLERKCSNCGARSFKNFGREKAWSIPFLKGEPQLKCI